MSFERCPAEDYVDTALASYVQAGLYRRDEIADDVTLLRANGAPLVDRAATAGSVAETLATDSPEQCNGPCQGGTKECIILNNAVHLLVMKLVGSAPRIETKFPAPPRRTV